jgi:hypothetical protein
MAVDKLNLFLKGHILTEVILKKPNKDSVANAAKNALNWTKETAGKAKDKSREGLDRAYEAKRPFAVAALEELRADNPKASPRKIQEILDEQLKATEAEFDSSSLEFSSAVSLYVFTSLELHDIDEEDEDKHQKLIDLVVILDSSAVKFARKAVGVAATVVAFLPQGKAIKGVAVARKAVAGAAIAKGVLNKTKGNSRVAKTIIERTAKVLGPAPAAWPAETPKPKATKKATKPTKE